MEKIIELEPLAEIGKGSARVCDNCVEIEISGISGGMKAWLIGGREDAVAIGNIVDGRLSRQINTGMHSGVLITQSGRQMLIGRYRDSENIENVIKDTVPFKISGFDWKKVTGRKFDGFCEELQFLISNKSVYNSYKKHGHYWIGEGDGSSALAIACLQDEVNLSELFGGMGIYKNGYVIVCVDKETKRIYVPKGM